MIYHVSTYEFQKDDKLLFDSHLLIIFYANLHGDVANKFVCNAEEYEVFFTDARKNKVNLLVNWTILSEYANYLDAAKLSPTDISCQLLSILKVSSLTPHTCDGSSMFNHKVLRHFQEGVGFNDSLIAREAIQGKWKIVTDDSGFTKIPGIDIITANPAFFS